LTRAVEELRVEEKTVVVMDMRSSSAVVENLTQTGNLQVLRNLLISMKKFLAVESIKANFEVYKFAGDGWVILFPGAARVGDPAA
jgi:hypothetical protein